VNPSALRTCFSMPVGCLPFGWNHSLQVKLDGSLKARARSGSSPRPAPIPPCATPPPAGDSGPSAPNPNHPQPLPLLTPGGGNTRIAAGWDHTCAIVAGGQVKCLGSNGFGQLGEGDTTNRTTPVTVTGLTVP
jgi:hypothetical protein